MNKRICIALTGLTLAAGAVHAARVEETDAAFTYNGTWTATNDPNASGGSFTTSGTVGNTVSFSVTGNNFVLYRKVEPNGGYASVTVDGKDFGRLSFYGVQAVSQVPAAIDKLGDGQHQIVLTVLQDMPRGSAGTNVYVDAMENPAPATAGPSQAQQDAVTRTNYYRNLIGLPPASHNLALGLAAVAHAKYLDDVDFVGNGGHPHNEVQGRSPFFTAVRPVDRDEYFGFTGNGGTEDANNTSDPITFVDGWMDGVYHREPFTFYRLTEIGFGGLPKGSCIDFASTVNQRAAPAATLTTTFPASDQTDVWISYDGTDGPKNVTPGTAYGFPIGLVVSFPDNATKGTVTTAATTATLTDAAGNNVPVIVADKSTDSQLSSYFMIPAQPLALATVYTARMSGVDLQNNAFDKTWKFTTAGANAVHNVRAVQRNSYIYSINWDMPTGGVPSQLEFGPTTAYGSVIAGELYPGRQTTFRAQVPGVLTTAGTMHYRVTSKDAQGNAYATPDHSITVDTAIPAATVGFLKVTPSAGGAFMQWETAGAVTSTQVKYGVDTTYGSTQAARLYGGYTTWFYADIQTLTAGATYHYQIVTTDAQGNTLTTPDATFVVQ